MTEDYNAKYESAKQRYPDKDPIHVMMLEDKGVDLDKIYQERDAFYDYRKLLGEWGYGMPDSKLPDGGPGYWCGGMGCMSDAEIGYVEKQVAKGVSFIDLLKDALAAD